VCIRVNSDAAAQITLNGIDVDILLKQTESSMEIVFNNALRPFKQRVNFIFFYHTKPIQITTNSTEDDYNVDMVKALVRNADYLAQHKLGGYDITITLVHHSNSSVTRQSPVCGGGAAYSFTAGLPHGVVALNCLVNDRFDVVVHEVKHVYGAGHDLETRIKDLKVVSADEVPITDVLGYKLCGAAAADSVRTIMSYDCRKLYVKRIPHFSCAHYTYDDKPIGYAATTDKHGSSNCDVIHMNALAVSNFGRTHPILAARQHRLSS
jgi:Metallo-peptidase family M12B Reprolysin-like